MPEERNSAAFNQTTDSPSESTLPGGLDRQAYLKSVRAGLLKKLGLPEDTRPEQVERLLAIKARLDKLRRE